MKSYRDHLSSTKSFGEVLPANYKPTMRSSAIFPIKYIPNKFDSIITFMGYWLIKRKIKQVTVLLTLRNNKGDKILIKNYLIDQIKSYVFRISDLFKDKYKKKTFLGSLEIEIYSSVDMVFPYPAITLVYETKLGKTFVHSAGRIYNSLDDLDSNSSQLVPETGFDVFLKKDYLPFFSFINGPFKIKKKKFTILAIDKYGKKKKLIRIINKLNPYEMLWVKIFNNNSEKKGLKGEKITVKIIHSFEGIFPRFIAGNNYKKNEAVSLTHTYYDTSADKSPYSIYKNPDKKIFLDSFVSIPMDKAFGKIELAIYPNLKLHPTKLNIEYFDKYGKLIYSKNSSEILIGRKNKLIYLDLLNEFNSVSKFNEGLCKISMDGKGKIATRLKFGLNFYKKKNKINLPSNICFNAILPNEKILLKKKTFKWCAIFSYEHQKIFLTNSSYLIDYSKNAKIEARVIRSSDDKFIKFNMTICPNGMLEFIKINKEKIKNFLKNEIGWVSFTSNSPFLNGYYLTDYNKGVIGADHLF